MFKKFEVHGVHAKVDAKLRAYATRKLGSLDKYIPRHSRESAHADVHLKETKKKGSEHCRCEVTLHLPQQTIVVKEQALNMYAAIDITEAKLKQQLQKYKDLHANGRMRRHVIARLRRRPVASEEV